MPTKLLYLDDCALLASPARVVDLFWEEEREVVVLDQTIFHPQGGGQPYDQGVIESPQGKFLVEEARLAGDRVKHIGRFADGTFTVGDNVRLLLDCDRRVLHSRIHSVGHVVDLAVAELRLGWIPGKGYHFPAGPYVEYAGSLNGLDVAKLRSDLETAYSALIEQGHDVTIQFMDYSELGAVCRFIPDYLEPGKPARVVLFGENFGVPCGGTHVGKLSEIGRMTIRKIKFEKGNIRVGYDVAR